MSDLVLLSAQLKREWIMTKRYFFNSIGGFIGIFAIFILIFMGYKGFAGGSEGYGQGLGNLVVGYTMWMLALIIYQDISHTLMNEAREGILEQLYMSPYGYTKITIFRIVISVTINFIMVVIVFLIMLLITGRNLNLDVFSIAPMVVLFLLPIIGLSFILGGAQLIFKKIDAFMQLVQFALIALVALPVDGPFVWARFLPGTLASNLVREIMVKDLSIFNISTTYTIITLVTGIGYLLVGFCIFKLCERKAMSDGRLAHY